MSFLWGGSSAKNEWDKVELEGFPDPLCDAAASNLLDVVDKQLADLAAQDQRVALEVHRAMHAVGESLAVQDGKADGVVEVIARAMDERQKQDIKKLTASRAKLVGANDTAASVKGGYLSGWLGQRGFLMRSKVSWKFHVLTGKRLLGFDTEEKFITSGSHAFLIPLEKCSNAELADKDTGFDLVVEGSRRTFLTASRVEANRWVHTIRARLALIAFVRDKEAAEKKDDNAAKMRDDVARVTQVFRNVASSEWDLSGVQMDLTTLNALAILLLSNPNVTKIKMDRCAITDSLLDKSTFCSALGQTTHVAWLSLRNNSISSDGAMCLSKVFHKESIMQHLFLDHNPLTPDGVQRLLHTLSLQAVSLLTITLSHAKLDHTAVTTVCRMKKEQMNSFRVRVNPDQAEGEGTSLSFRVDLSHNDLGDKGLAVAAQYVRKHGIATLNVRNCGGSEQGVVEVVEAAFTHIGSLESLDVSENGWGPNAEAAIAKLILNAPEAQSVSSERIVLPAQHLACMRGVVACGLCNASKQA